MTESMTRDQLKLVKSKLNEMEIDYDAVKKEKEILETQLKEGKSDEQLSAEEQQLKKEQLDLVKELKRSKMEIDTLQNMFQQSEQENVKLKNEIEELKKQINK